MRVELSEKLFEKYPDLYSGRKEPFTQNLMGFGFECEDGWYDIIDELSQKLEPLGVKAMQVKEKFGTLRFYIISGTADEAFDMCEAFDLCDEAERKSETTCEECGNTGHLRTDEYWLRTLCDACSKKRQ